jgi:hypothetical protein
MNENTIHIPQMHNISLENLIMLAKIQYMTIREEGMFVNKSYLKNQLFVRVSIRPSDEKSSP